MLKMKELPKNERPRERLMRKGVESLNNEELLCILLTSGGKNKSVKEVSCSLLKEVKGIGGLSNISYEKLIQMKGIGPAKACLLLASLELGKRVSQKDIQNKIIKSAQDVFSYYHPKLLGKQQEYFYCMYLDQRKRLVKEKLLFLGTMNQSLVHPREIFKEAYCVGATGIICVHNHPSGSILPSKEDSKLTKRMKEIGILLGIPLIDHVIIARNQYFSFQEQGIE